jgi:hypothetical protein
VNIGRDIRILGRRLRITGVRFSPHTMRHTFAVSFLRNGGDVYVLSRILGHANITTTTVYLRSLGMDILSQAHQKFSTLSALRRVGSGAMKSKRDSPTTLDACAYLTQPNGNLVLPHDGLTFYSRQFGIRRIAFPRQCASPHVPLPFQCVVIWRGAAQIHRRHRGISANQVPTGYRNGPSVLTMIIERS